MISGLSHMTFIVKDLDRMARIIVEVLGGKQVYSNGDKTFSLSREKFFVAGGLWIAIMEGEPRSAKSYDHVAFKIEAGKLKQPGAPSKLLASMSGNRVRALMVKGNPSIFTTMTTTCLNCTRERWMIVWLLMRG